MYLIITSCVIFLISNICLASIDNHPKNFIIQNELCKNLEEICQENNDCCSDLICSQNNICIPSTFNEYSKRNSEDFFVPPYYNPKNQLYPYGIRKPALPFYKSPQASESKKLEWDHCLFHEDCGEGNCCYVHFRFRSLPKWFCRPNRNDIRELCQPLAKYRSLKDIPAWKQQQQQQER